VTLGTTLSETLAALSASSHIDRVVGGVLKGGGVVVERS